MCPKRDVNRCTTLARHVDVIISLMILLHGRPAVAAS